MTLLHSHKTPLLEKTTIVKIVVFSQDIKSNSLKLHHWIDEDKNKRCAEDDKMQEHSILRLFLFYIGTSARSGSHNKLAKVHSMID